MSQLAFNFDIPTTACAPRGACPSTFHVSGSAPSWRDLVAACREVPADTTVKLSGGVGCLPVGVPTKMQPGVVYSSNGPVCFYHAKAGDVVAWFEANGFDPKRHQMTYLLRSLARTEERLRVAMEARDMSQAWGERLELGRKLDEIARFTAYVLRCATEDQEPAL